LDEASKPIRNGRNEFIFVMVVEETNGSLLELGVSPWHQNMQSLDW
jgi:hypothetical protein